MGQIPAKPPKSPDIDKLIPDRIMRLLGERPTLPFENLDAFDALHSELVVEYGPRNLVEHIQIREIADALWELRRLRSLRRAGVESELADVMVEHIAPHYQQVESVNHEKAVKCVRNIMIEARQGNKTQQEELEGYLEWAHKTHPMMQYEAYKNGLPTLTALEEVISRLERRYEQLVRTFEERRRNIDAMSRSLIDKSQPVADVSVSAAARVKMG